MDNKTITEFKEKDILTDKQKYTTDLKDIAILVKQQLKKEYPRCVFSVTIERYSMGQSLHINLMRSDVKVIKNFNDIPSNFKEYLGTGYTTEDIKRMQGEKYHQLNEYALIEDFDPSKWCNGVYLTKEGHKLFKRVVEISRHFNYNHSDSMTDYYNVNFYLSVSIGKWNKPFIEETD